MLSGLVIAGGYLVLLATSGTVVRFFLSRIGSISPNQKGNYGASEQELATGAVIGKCENIIILTLMILGAYTALAIVFTAKALIRKEDMKENSLFFLAGTLINVTYSVLAGLAVKAILLTY